MVTAKLWVFDLGLSVAVGGVGIGAAWWMRRFTLLSARNLYPGAAVGVLGIAVSALLGWRVGQLVLLPIAAPWVAAASVGHRWRQSDLGAGEELRAHELSRRWLWEPRRRLPQGERRFLGSQGELVHERQWPDSLAYVSMTAERAGGARLPLGAGQHVVMFGATGAGKTTTARRLIAARTLAQHSALLVLDQKGDAADVREMRALAAAAGVPFILFDSQDPDTDRWQPLWGTPRRGCRPRRGTHQAVRALLLRRAATASGHRLPGPARRRPLATVDPDARRRVPTAALPSDTCDRHGSWRRAADSDAARERARPVCHLAARNRGPVGRRFRLEVALALASRQMVTPRPTPNGETVAVRLVEALRQRAVVMWRTHADTMPDEAAALSVLALADLHDAAEQANVPWTLLLDEFGAVIKMAAQRAMAILQRGRSHGGQVIVITQSAADIEALTGQTGLLASLTDNFAGIVAPPPNRPGKP